MHHRQQNTRDIRENLRCRRYHKKNIDTTVKENAKSKKIITPNIQKIQDTIVESHAASNPIAEESLACHEQSPL